MVRRRNNNMAYLRGLDLGQAADYTALVIAGRAPTDPKPEFHVRHLYRYTLGTPYPVIVNEVSALTETAQLQGKCTLVIDRTGCGRPVFDSFQEARLSCPLYGLDSWRCGRESRRATLEGAQC